MEKSDELFTLNELGVQSIETTHEVTATNVGSGNVARAVGTFTYADGNSENIPAEAASLYFVTNTFYRDLQEAA